MFDNVPKPVPKPPVDMFDGVDRPPTPQAVPPSGQTIAPPPTSLPPTPPPSASMPMPASGLGVGKVLLVIIVGLLIMGGSGYLAYRLMAKPAEDDSVVNAIDDGGLDDEDVAQDDETASNDEDVADEPAKDEAPGQEDDRRKPGSFLDSDGDGLTNAEELEAGTSVTKDDTDGDGLGDREEVKVYSTDPKDVDTDGDTYLDGQEVAGGYNPNGTGRLFSIPE